VTVTLRRASADDVEHYVRIEKKVASRTNITITDSQQALERIEGSIVYMILDDEIVVGLATYEYLEPVRVYIKKLSIDPDFQGRGVGGEAFRLVMEELGTVARVELVTHPENPVIPLFFKHGFMIEGYVEDFKGTGEPRYSLARTLPKGL
jgi:ribosomal protein S18 acetylase RimI-like enzyme